MRHLRLNSFTPLLLALGYFVTGRLGLMLPAFGSSITLVWLPTGIAVAALLRWGFGCWPGIALGAFAVNLAVGASWPVALGIAVGNTLGPLLAAWILQRVKFHPAFDRSRDILLLAAAAALGMVVSSGLGVATLALLGRLLPAARVEAWLTWWGGDTLGVIAAAPLVLTFSLVEVRAISRRRVEFVIWLIATCLSTWAAFIANRAAMPGQALAIAFTPFPFVAWAALQFGPVGTSLGLIILSVGAAYGTATQSGPFFRSDPHTEVALLWVFMATSAVLGWLISALQTKREQSAGTQRLFEQALTDVSLGVLLAGLDRRIAYANDGFTRLTGYPAAELLGKSCAILQGPETDTAMHEKLKTALHGAGFFDGEILNYRKDGTTFWNALLISPVRDERGVMTGFLGIQRNVTQRKQAEVALTQSEEHLRTIIDLEPECVKLLSPEGKLLEMNPAGLAMIEAGSLDEVRGLPVSELVVPEDRAAFAEAHRQALEGATGRCEFGVVGLKGTRRWLETHAVPYRNGAREIVGVLGITRDVTHRKEAEAEIGRSLSTLQLFVDTVPAYIAFVDAEERYRLVNQRYEEYFGKPAAQLIGQRLCDMQPAETYAEMQPHIRAALGGQTVRYQSNPTGPDGKTYWFDVQYVPRRGEGGAVTGFFVLVFDITENKLSEIALRESRSRFDSILNSMEDVVFSTTPEGDAMLFVSASAETLYGWPTSDLHADPMKWLTSIHPEDQAAAERAFHRVAERGEFDAEYRIIRPDGAVRWVHDRARIVKDADGHPLRLDGILTDITERREAGEALRKSEEGFRRLIEHAPEAVMLLDVAAGRFVQVNPAAERMFKMSAAELYKVGPDVMSPPTQPDGRTSSEKARQYVARAMEGGAPVFEWTHRDSEGREFPCEVRLLRFEIGGRAVVRGSTTDITERKRAEEAVQKARQRFEQLVSSVEGIVWEADAQTFEFNFVSEQAERLLGYPVQDWLESGFWAAHIHPDDRETATTFCATSTQQGRDHDFEYRMLAADGRVVWLRDIVTVLVEEGVPRLLRGLMVDITERKRAEEALHTAAEFTKSLIGSMQDGFSVLDADGVQSDVNPAFSRMTGFSREALIGTRPPYPYWPPEEYERIQAALRETMEGKAADFELTFMRQNGERFPVIVSPSAVRNQDGSVRSYCATVKDITERKRAEEERTHLLQSLEESQVRLQTLVSNLPGMAYRCLNDPNWTMSYVSEGCEAVTGYRRDELESNRTVAYADLIHVDDRDWLWAKCQKSLDARTPCQNEYRILDRTGRERWVSERASGVYAGDGTLLAIDGFIQDITISRQAKIERELLDRKMQETQKLESLGVLAGGIAHDFNNLLTAILGNASIAQIELPPGSSVQDCLEQINEASLRAADLCKQMLAYSGRGRFVVQTLDLGELVEQTAQMLQISISKKAVLRFRLEKGLPPVEVDATQMRQVIMNLVINASEAIGDVSGVISISTGLTRVDRDYLHSTLMDPDLPEGDYVFLEVSDSGCGMSAETKARIFDPFFTTKFTGRGLGLAAVLGIVRGHKGAMKVYSEVGRGTTFKLLFPAAAGASENARAAAAVGPTWHGEGTVLVVDDEETMRSTVARMMRLLGLDPVLAADGREAVEIFRAQPESFALVLLDLTMPHLDGEQTFAELRRLRPDVRVVLMSGFNAQEALVRFPGKGLASFLQKPFSVDALRLVLKDVLGS